MFSRSDKIKGMNAKKTLKPLPVPLPMEYAEKLKIDPSFISHINAGRSHLGLKRAFQLLKMAAKDPRLTGLCILHLRPDFEEYLPYICTPFIISQYGAK